jgi:hypothetical protein
MASCLFGFALPALFGQATSTASRRADLQVGAGFVENNADYPYEPGGPQDLKGFAFYATLDLSAHLGGELVFHQANSSTGDQLYQRTYEIGPRYFRTYGRFAPYVKAMYGRGVFNFPHGAANLAYNMFAGGAGVDVRVLPFINVRADYEYQDWMGFPATGLTPQVLTFGVAYHFPGEIRRGKHY